MKYLLIATALSLGLCGTCLAAEPHQASHSTQTAAPQYPFAKNSKGFSCHMVGHKDVCKPTVSS